MSVIALSVDSLTKSWGRGDQRVQALADVSLTVERGEIVALLGNNGAGKSTLMTVCAGLAPADSGEVSVFGEPITGAATASRQVGLAPQEEALYPTLSVSQNLRYFAQLAGLHRSEQDERVQSVATSLGIGSLLDRRAGSLSGGQRRRLHTGLALLHDPDLLLLDEPTVGVDIEARGELLDFVSAMAAAGKGILYSTHQLNEAEVLSSRVVVIEQGQVLAAGSTPELMARFAPPEIRLVFNDPHVVIPDVLLDSLSGKLAAVGAGVELTFAVPKAGATVGELVDILPLEARQQLLVAETLEPSLERVYLSLLASKRGSTPTVSEPDGMSV